MTLSMNDAGSNRRLVSARRRAQMRRVGREHVVELARELDANDPGASRHCETVARYAETIARELELPADVCEAVHLAGLLHDVGKIGVPTTILGKPGPLSESEWAEMQAHPRIGAEILGSAGLRGVRDWVHSHHERPDGAGYPRGLTDAEIPIEAKILAVADSYEAMTNDRAYRAAIGHQEAVEELRRNAGTQFDEAVVEVFLRVLGRETRSRRGRVAASAA
jgi:putative nucleotidyltransferase with HDIG domain